MSIHAEPVRAGAATRRALCYLETHVAGDVSLVRCAEHVRLNPSYLSSLIKQETGLTFSEHLAFQKLSYIKRRLLATDLPIHQIAQEIGYTERSLYRLFTRREGQSPGAFRGARARP